MGKGSHATYLPHTCDDQFQLSRYYLQYRDVQDQGTEEVHPGENKPWAQVVLLR